jgi:GNAT superfamily N-acetyltransferase
VAINYARQQNAERIILYTARKLKRAIELYQHLGFTEVDAKQPPGYERCTFTMELILRDNTPS